jgi:hypothetical protein
MLCAWVPAVVPRSLRGRPSQVKGASGVANAMPLARHPGPASLHGPLRAALRAGHEPALHNARHHRRHPRTQHNHAQNSENNNTQRPKPPDPLDTAPPLQG